MQKIYKSIEETLNQYKNYKTVIQKQYLHNLSLSKNAMNPQSGSQSHNAVFKQINDYFHRNQQHILYPSGLGQFQITNYILIHLCLTVKTFQFVDYEIVQTYLQEDIQQIQTIQKYFYQNILKQNHLYDLAAQLIYTQTNIGLRRVAAQLLTMKDKTSLMTRLLNLLQFSLTRNNDENKINWYQQKQQPFIKKQLWIQQIKIQQIQKQINNTFVLYFQYQRQYYPNFVLTVNIFEPIIHQLIRIEALCYVSMFKYQMKQYKMQLLRTVIIHQIFWCRVAISLFYKMAYSQSIMISEQYLKFKTKINTRSDAPNNDMGRLIIYQIKSLHVLIKQHIQSQFQHLLHFMLIRPLTTQNQFKYKIVEIQDKIRDTILTNKKIIGDKQQSIFRQFDIINIDPAYQQLQNNGYINKTRKQIEMIDIPRYINSTEIKQQKKRKGLTDHILQVQAKFNQAKSNKFIQQSKDVIKLLTGYHNNKKRLLKQLQLQTLQNERKHTQMESTLYHFLYRTLIPNQQKVSDDQVYYKQALITMNSLSKTKIQQKYFQGPIYISHVSGIQHYEYNFCSIFNIPKDILYNIPFIQQNPKPILLMTEDNFKQTSTYKKFYPDRNNFIYQKKKMIMPVDTTKYLQIQSKSAYQSIFHIVNKASFQQKVLDWIQNNQSDFINKMIELQRNNFPPLYRNIYYQKQLFSFFSQGIQFTPEQKQQFKDYILQLLMSQSNFWTREDSNQQKYKKFSLMLDNKNLWKRKKKQREINDQDIKDRERMKQQFEIKSKQIQILQSKFQFLKHYSRLSIDQIRKSLQAQTNNLKLIENMQDKRNYLTKIIQLKRNQGINQDLMYSIINQVNIIDRDKDKLTLKMNSANKQQMKKQLQYKQKRYNLLLQQFNQKSAQYSNVNNQFQELIRTMKQQRIRHQNQLNQLKSFKNTQMIPQQNQTQYSVSDLTSVLEYVKRRFQHFNIRDAKQHMMLFNNDFQQNLHRYLKYKTTFDITERKQILQEAAKKMQQTVNTSTNMYNPVKQQQKLQVNTQVMKRFMNHITAIMKKTKAYRALIQIRIKLRRIQDQQQLLKIQETKSALLDEQTNFQVVKIAKNSIYVQQIKYLKQKEDELFNIMIQYVNSIKRKYDSIILSIPNIMLDANDPILTKIYSYLQTGFKRNNQPSLISGDDMYFKIQSSFQNKLKGWADEVLSQINDPSSKLNKIDINLKNLPSQIQQFFKTQPNSINIAQVILRLHKQKNQIQQQNEELTENHQLQIKNIECITKKIINFVYLGMRTFLNVQKLIQMGKIKGLGSLAPIINKITSFANQPAKLFNTQFQHLFECITTRKSQHLLSIFQLMWSNVRNQQGDYPPSISQKFKQLHKKYKQHMEQIAQNDYQTTRS